MVGLDFNQEGEKIVSIDGKGRYSISTVDTGVSLLNEKFERAFYNGKQQLNRRKEVIF